MSNRLGNEKSPYLLQHADNPVEWFPWGEEAFRVAREKDRPIFLSIGYATCHWCHVMAHESFEDEEVARLLNENFVSVKVDREERPDVDHVYMTVCQVLTGSGGWPTSIFMTPEGKPFFAGTYFPKTGRMGMQGFVEILTQIAAVWKRDRDRVLQAGDEITLAIQPKKGASAGSTPNRESLEAGYGQLKSSFDDRWGGFSKAPKFPTPHHLTFLLRWHRRNPDSRALAMVEKTLDSMRSGGIFDHIGFGFHRYSVDERWLVPHFEKMLYDQAMLAMAYTEAFQVSGNERHARVVREIFEYVLRDMTAPEGGFYSAEDADSEGREGWFYVWKPEEVKEVLGEDAGDLFCRVFDISSVGNFEEGRSIPHLARPLESYAVQFGMNAGELERVLEDARRKLFLRRKERVHPLKDDKILTSWNGLMIAALAKGFQALRDGRYIDAARKAADFVLGALRRDSGRLLRRFRQGETAIPAYADDYAFLVWGLLEVYESTFHIRYFEEAVSLSRQMFDLFWDSEDGGFFTTARDSEALIVRDKEIYDGAIPSANSVAALNVPRIARMTGDLEWEGRADRLLKAFSSIVGGYPSAYTQFLNAVDFTLGPSRDIVIAGKADHEDTRKMVEAVQIPFLPNKVLMLREEGEYGERLVALAPFVKPLGARDGRPTAYVCENYACKEPVSDVGALKSSLGIE